MSNTELAKIVVDNTTELTPEQMAGLVTALESRENEKLDNLRYIASQEGLMASIVESVIIDLHLGSEVTPEQHALVSSQAAADRQEIARAVEAFRRQLGGES